MSSALRKSVPPGLRSSAFRLSVAGCLLTSVLCGSAFAQTNVFPSTGNVGIGTTSPANKLEVYGGRVLLDDGSNSGWLFPGSSGGLTAFHIGSKTNVPLAFFTNSSGPRMTISTTGSVGIGTTNPQTKLDVDGDIYVGYNTTNTSTVQKAFATAHAPGNVPSVFTTGLVDGGGLVGMTVNDVRDGSFNSQSIEFTTHHGGVSTGTRMTIDKDGNVGIGTTNPGSALDVIKPGNANVYENGIRVNRPDSQGQYAFIGYAQLSSDAYFGSVYTGAAGYYGRIFLRQYTQGMTARDAVMIDSSGSVGIGTTTPTEQLEVLGGIKSSGSTAGMSRLVLQSTANGGQQYEWYNDYAGTGSGVLGLYNRTSGNNPMAVTANGNVGIGTSAPTHKLAVNGTIRAKEVIVDTGWADYVFADDYHLAPLSEVEAHIREKKHLPGIPSAAEVTEHGVNMGEMQAKLLAKVEELTLHVIAQQKKLSALESENTGLRQRVQSLEAGR